MKLFKLLAVIALSPMLFLATANADDEGVPEEAPAVSKPTITYYFLDG